MKEPGEIMRFTNHNSRITIHESQFTNHNFIHYGSVASTVSVA